MKVEYVSHMGDDLAVVNAARVSFSKESEWATNWAGDPNGLLEKDRKLINYLARNNHWTPFGHTAITLRVKAPIPIRTQAFKHKQGFVENEESRRYISYEPELFVPDYFRKAPEGNKKQGSGDKHPDSALWEGVYINTCSGAIHEYHEMILDGICPEQARFILPQGVEVQWIWTGSLAAYARFYNLRTDSHAQKEIQGLAEDVGNIIEPLFPVSWKALTEGDV